MKTNTLLFLFLLCLFASCSGDVSDEICGGNDPINQLTWLAEIVKENADFGTDYTNIATATLNDKQVFIIDSCCPHCNTLPAKIFECDGTLLGMGNEIDWETVTNRKTIYKGKDNVCTGT
ncbi:hypothetical protein [Sediminicola luteus]|uniref:Lipoprotein n=1 Tax=Sediminicola luteus TaxID=319238 RepID=A0A2A4G8S8_9FLAO|nr:hypothetical protein [Sediminicola luteus]PCE64843.1 hypothetical protein B7P33_06655 [Sediminicola luteus]